MQEQQARMLWAIIIAVVITAFVVGGAVYFIQKEKISQANENLADLQAKYDSALEEIDRLEQELAKRGQEIDEINDNANQVKTEQLANAEKKAKVNVTKVKKYTSKKLAIKFDYPEELGEIKEKNDPDAAKVTLTTAENEPILVAADPDKSQDTDTDYWGDQAQEITSQSAVDNYCDGKDNCEVKTNQHGINYAKAVEEVTKKDSSKKVIATNYYLYHPTNDYSGIALSTAEIQDQVANAEQVLDTIVESLEFTDVTSSDQMNF